MGRRGWGDGDGGMQSQREPDLGGKPLLQEFYVF